MIELFAELLSKQDRVKISTLIESSIKNDRYIRDNAPLFHVMNEEIKASEAFFCLEDDYVYIKQEVYLSFLAHKILLSMKRFYQMDGHAHVVLICENKNAMHHILEDQILRVISQVQDAEYRATERSPITFLGKPKFKTITEEGYEAIQLEIPHFGLITMISFEDNRRRRLDQTNVIRHLINNDLDGYEEVTHFYKIDTVFREKYINMRGTFEDSCRRILEECMPMDCIHYTFTSKKNIHHDSYASRNAIPFALQLKESNRNLMTELLKAMHQKKDITVLENGYILDPISSVTENLELCWLADYRSLIETMDTEKERRRSVADVGMIRGQRAQSLWIDENRAPAYILGNEARGRSGRIVDRSIGFDPLRTENEAAMNEHLRQLQQLAISSMNAQLNPIFRYEMSNDPDETSFSVVPVMATGETRNRRTYSEETIRDAFLRNWIEEQE